jgi:hypothetical protein
VHPHMGITAFLGGRGRGTRLSACRLSVVSVGTDTVHPRTSSTRSTRAHHRCLGDDVSCGARSLDRGSLRTVQDRCFAYVGPSTDCPFTTPLGPCPAVRGRCTSARTRNADSSDHPNTAETSRRTSRVRAASSAATSRTSLLWASRAVPVCLTTPFALVSRHRPRRERITEDDPVDVVGAPSLGRGLLP